MLKNIFLIIFVAISINVYSSNIIQFRNISPPGGLIHLGINHIVQDKTGQIWFGSNDGLFCYNTKEITRFKEALNDSLSLRSNGIRALLVDNRNKLWIGTDKGLDLFDNITSNFIHIDYSSINIPEAGNSIKDIVQDNDNNIWINDNLGIGIFNPDSNTISYIAPTSETQLPNKLFFDKWSRGWICFPNGTIYRFFPEDKKFVPVLKYRNPLLRCIHMEKEKIIAGYAGSIRIFNMHGEQIKFFSRINFNKTSYPIKRVNDITVDYDGVIWAATYQGLIKIDSTGEPDLIMQSSTPSLPHNSVHSVFIDSENSVWIGTWAGGIAYYHRSDNFFEDYTQTKLQDAISENVISSFAETNDGTIYIGTETTGLNTFNSQTRTFNKVILKDEQEVINIKSLATDNRGGLWVGTLDNHLFYKPDNAKSFQNIKRGNSDGEHLSGNNIYYLNPDKNGVWITIIGSGINYYNLKTGNIEYYNEILKEKNIKQNGTVYISFCDSKENLWLGRWGECIKVNKADTTVQYFNADSPRGHQLPKEDINHITEISNGDVWIGFNNSGVRIYNPYYDSIKSLELDEGFKTQDVFGIQEDKQGRIWMTTDKGLIVYYPKTDLFRRFTHEKEQTRQYLSASIFKDSKNYLYFGSTRGFLRFNADHLKVNMKPPKTFISKILINNKDQIHPELDFTPSGYNYKTLRLPAKDNSLQIDCYSDNYLMSDENRYKYRMVNFTDNWVTISNKEKAIFTKIPSGNYIFEILSCNNDGVWQKNPTQLKIEIDFPWYQSPLAYLAYALSLLTIGFVIYKEIKNRRDLKHKVIIEQLKSEHEQQMHEAKLQFFTNVSHEFRTPLTLISGPVKELINSTNLTELQQKYIEIIKNNSNRLLTLIDQIMDFRKMEKGKTSLILQHVELVSFVKERFENFSQEANSRNLNFNMEYDNNAIQIDVDTDKLDKIIYNLLSNAFKHVPDHGKIAVKIQVKQSKHQLEYENQLKFGDLTDKDFVTISVEDSGSGIESEDILRIFNRFEQGIKIGAGTGIGLNLTKEYIILHNGQITVQSTPNKGSCFTVFLPQKQRAQNILGQITNLPLVDANNMLKHQKIEGTISYNKNVTILIVDDNKDMLEFIRSLLYKHYNTITATDGSDALRKLYIHDIDIIISDVMMPQIDGFSFCKKVKSDLSVSHIPIILLTALSSKESKLEGLKTGADAYIIKPFDKDILIGQIDNLLSQREALKKKYNDILLNNTKQTLIDESEFVPIENAEQLFLKKATKVVSDNMQNELFGVELMATELSLSRSQLHRKLKYLTGYSANEFIKIHKLNEAARLLKNTDKTIDEISYLAGFGTHSWFSKCFKEVYKMSPNKFRDT